MSRIATGEVLRALPRLGVCDAHVTGSPGCHPPCWGAIEQGIAAPLLRLDADPLLPERSAVRDAVPAWWRVSALVRAEQERPVSDGSPCPDVCLVTVAPADVDAIGACARELGRALLPEADRDLVRAMQRAVPPGAGPERLVVGLARLHGVLDLDHGQAGEVLHVLAGIRTSRPDLLATHRHVADRVGRMWSAGEG